MEVSNKMEVQIVDEVANITYSAKLSPEEIENISVDPVKYEALIEKLRKENISKFKVGETENQCSGSTNRWTPNNIKLLLNIRLGMEEKFIKPSVKKNKLWIEIAQKMKEKGHEVTGDDCNNKYRNLLQTYKQNKEKRLKTTGESKISWEYFDSILGNKSSTLPPLEMLLEDNPSTSEETVIPEKKRKKDDKKGELSLGRYLYLKTERASEKEKRQEEKWEQEQQIKKAEIDAIRELAKAISSQSNHT